MTYRVVNIAYCRYCKTFSVAYTAVLLLLHVVLQYFLVCIIAILNCSTFFLDIFSAAHNNTFLP